MCWNEELLLQLASFSTLLFLLICFYFFLLYFVASFYLVGWNSTKKATVPETVEIAWNLSRTCLNLFHLSGSGSIYPYPSTSVCIFPYLATQNVPHLSISIHIYQHLSNGYYCTASVCIKIDSTKCWLCSCVASL